MKATQMVICRFVIPAALYTLCSAMHALAGTAWTVTPDTILDTRDPVNAPTNLAPANGALVNTLMPKLSTSPFAPSFPGRTHFASQWQLSEDAGFGTTTWDSAETTAALTNQTVPEGALATTNRFYWRARYKNDAGGWSPYSEATYFALSGAHIRVSANLLDFGDVIIGNSTQLTLNVENVGNEMLDGSVSGISNPFSVVSGIPYALDAMSNVDVVFNFEPYEEESYAQSAALTGGGGAQVDLTGTGIPEPFGIIIILLVSGFAFTRNRFRL